MGKRLSDNLTSKYFEAANRLTSKKARRRIVAYVESYDDVFFWRTVLSRFENESQYFQVMLPSRFDHLERGKKAVMMRLLSQQVGHDMIACVDADYDYLMQGATETSREVLSNPYVFHTYAYAIENLQCYAPSLYEVCVATTLNDHAIFNIDEYLRQYSLAIFPLFVWSIWYYSRPTTKTSPSAISTASSKPATSTYKTPNGSSRTCGAKWVRASGSCSSPTPTPKSPTSP